MQSIPCVVWHTFHVISYWKAISSGFKVWLKMLFACKHITRNLHRLISSEKSDTACVLYCVLQFLTGLMSATLSGRITRIVFLSVLNRKTTGCIRIKGSGGLASEDVPEWQCDISNPMPDKLFLLASRASPLILQCLSFNLIEACSQGNKCKSAHIIHSIAFWDLCYSNVFMCRHECPHNQELFDLEHGRRGTRVSSLEPHVRNPLCVDANLQENYTCSRRKPPYAKARPTRGGWLAAHFQLQIEVGRDALGSLS